MAAVEQKTVDSDEADMRVDRWFKAHYPDLAFGALQKLLRTGQVRVDGSRVKADSRLQPGQTVRVPPLAAAGAPAKGPMTARTIRNQSDEDALKRMILFEDKKVIVLNKPAGLAVQGGSGITRHIDGMMEAFRNAKGEKPRLVHRIDRDTSGILVIARTRGAAQRLTAAFRERDTQKTYWALVKGVPKKREGRISTWLVKEPTRDGDRMRVCKHGEPDSEHAVTDYRTVESAGHRLSWLEMEPVTGRTHQLRVHAAHMGNPIVGDPKYFEDDPNWEFPGGMQKKLHLHARRIIIPHPDGGIVNVTAPLPPHMVQSWNLLGFKESDADMEEE